MYVSSQHHTRQHLSLAHLVEAGDAEVDFEEHVGQVADGVGLQVDGQRVPKGVLVTLVLMLVLHRRKRLIAPHAPSQCFTDRHFRE